MFCFQSRDFKKRNMKNLKPTMNNITPKKISNPDEILNLKT